MSKRSVLSVVILSFITCGIYAIYWFYVSAKQLNEKQPEQPLRNYIIACLLSCITCGIYGIYWLYKFFKKLDEVTGESNLVLNLLLAIFTGGIVSMAIAQNSMNNYQ